MHGGYLLWQDDHGDYSPVRAPGSGLGGDGEVVPDDDGLGCAMVGDGWGRVSVEFQGGLVMQLM